MMSISAVIALKKSIQKELTALEKQYDPAHKLLFYMECIPILVLIIAIERMIQQWIRMKFRQKKNIRKKRKSRRLFNRHKIENFNYDAMTEQSRTLLFSYTRNKPSQCFHEKVPLRLSPKL